MFFSSQKSFTSLFDYVYGMKKKNYNFRYREKGSFEPTWLF